LVAASKREKLLARSKVEQTFKLFDAVRKKPQKMEKYIFFVLFYFRMAMDLLLLMSLKK
jgi:hypothetical protein